MVTRMGTRHVQTRVIYMSEESQGLKFEGQRHLTIQTTDKLRNCFLPTGRATVCHILQRLNPHGSVTNVYIE